MSKQDLFKQAIAEARELKEISMAQAKQQIAEAFAPRISEMFALKVNELEEADKMEEVADGLDEMDNMEEADKMEEVNETSLDEILAELEMEDSHQMEENLDLEEGSAKGDDEIQEAKKDEEAEEETEEEAPEADDAEDAEMDVDSEEDSQDVAELSVEEFKNLVRDVVADVLAGQDQAGADEMGDELPLDGMDSADMGSDMGGEDDAISLDEILAELENEGLEEDKHNTVRGQKAKDYVPVHASDKAKAHHAGADKKGDSKNLRTFTRPNPERKEGESVLDYAKRNAPVVNEAEDDLAEAMKTIEELKTQINETNLFNAKMLYTNKIFEATNLSRTQKEKVLGAFDKAKSVNEVKTVYSALNSTMSTPTAKNTIRESVGFASKPIGSAPARPIVEANDAFTRMQQLAGIKKLY